jgi:hypothetical protein
MFDISDIGGETRCLSGQFSEERYDFDGRHLVVILSRCRSPTLAVSQKKSVHFFESLPIATSGATSLWIDLQIGETEITANAFFHRHGPLGSCVGERSDFRASLMKNIHRSQT